MAVNHGAKRRQTGIHAEGCETFESLRNQRRNRLERAGFALYGAAVAASREPFFYATLGVPDTLDGRFDLLALHAFLIIDRVSAEPAPGPGLAQAVFDAMFSDMDLNLREMGVGDLSVGKKVRRMWEAFHGRSLAYRAALRCGDASALAQSIGRNVWRGATPPAGAVEALARLVSAQQAHLATQDLRALAVGRATFLEAAEAAR